MMNILEIQNHGPLITGSNYWESEMAARGYYYVSINAGAIRLLVPNSMRAEISEMRKGAKHVVVSMLPPEKWEDGKYAIEWMVEDGSETPYALHLSPPQIDRRPPPEDVGREFIATIWDQKKGRPHKCLERPAYLQIVPSLPWLKRIDR